ncbi:MBL fold metallo-hydrolase [bacterium]|nr:MBL fold metallo-hydrolase [bacterium]
MNPPLTYTGGLADTNAYLLDLHGHLLAIDAPEGFLDFLKKKKLKPDSLLLTHGHWDHIWDAADLAEWAKCPVYYHPDTAFLCLQPDSMLAFGLPQKLRPVRATQLLDETTPPASTCPVPINFLVAMSFLPTGWDDGTCREATENSCWMGSEKKSFPSLPKPLSTPGTDPPPPWAGKKPRTRFYKLSCLLPDSTSSISPVKPSPTLFESSLPPTLFPFPNFPPYPPTTTSSPHSTSPLPGPPSSHPRPEQPRSWPHFPPHLWPANPAPYPNLSIPPP